MKEHDEIASISQWTYNWVVAFSPPKTESLVIYNNIYLDEHPLIHMERTKVVHLVQAVMPC